MCIDTTTTLYLLIIYTSNTCHLFFFWEFYYYGQHIYRVENVDKGFLGFSVDKHKLMIISKHSDRVTRIMEDIRG